LDRPALNPNNDYLKNPNTTVNGQVSNPSAKVELNSNVLEVQQNGTFTADILSKKGGNVARAVATLGEETDVYTVMWLISDQGQPGFVPGYDIGYQTQLTTKVQQISLKAGESTTFELGISIGKANPISAPASVSIRRVAKLGDVPSLPMLTDISISVEPSGYIGYPKIEYLSQIIIETSPGLAPGDYYYEIAYSGSFTNLYQGLTISVK
jgi:hypothetical protein